MLFGMDKDGNVVPAPVILFEEAEEEDVVEAVGCSTDLGWVVDLLHGVPE